MFACRSRPTARLIVLSLGAAGAVSAAGQTTVTLRQAIALALERNTDVRSSQTDVDAAHGVLVQARALQNPTLTVGASSIQVSPLDGPVPNQFGVSWTVPVGGKRAAGISAASAGLSAAKATRAATEQQLKLNAATAFVNVLLAEGLLSFARSDQQSFGKTLELNEVRYRDGKIAYGDVLKLRIQALTQDDAVRQAEENLVNARADLAQVAGEDALAPGFVVQGSLEPPPQRPDRTPESVLSLALQKRPDYAAAKEQVESATSALTQARRQPIPDLGVGFNYNHASGFPDSYDLALSVAVPLFDQNRGNIEEARAALEKARIAQEAVRNQLRQAAEKAVAEWRSSSAQVAAYVHGLRESARQSLEIRRRAYEVGGGSLLDFLDAETSYRQVESAYRSALARNALAAYTVSFVAGEDIP
jgi:outer membrane protein, heavy metal efflux system